VTRSRVHSTPNTSDVVDEAGLEDYLDGLHERMEDGETIRIRRDDALT
jgi:hypothetical protein